MCEHFLCSNAISLPCPPPAHENTHTCQRPLPTTNLIANEHDLIIESSQDDLKLLPKSYATSSCPEWLRRELSVFRQSDYFSAVHLIEQTIDQMPISMKIALTKIEHSPAIQINITPSLSKAVPKQFYKEAAALLAPFAQSPLLTFLTRIDGAIIDANPRFFQMTGLEKNHLQDKHWQDLIVNATGNEHNDLLQGLREKNCAENLELTFEFPTLQPPQRIGLLSARRVECQDRPCILFTINDISAVRHLTREFCHLEGLKVASELAAGIGHEIRNPMTSVRGFLQMLRKKDIARKHDSYFNLMIEELDRADSIITEFLSLTKQHPRQITPTNLNTVIKQIFPLLKSNALLSNQSIALDLAPLPDLPLDHNEIRQLIINVVKNGLEAMAPGKNLTIKTSREEPNFITLAIRDEGNGIPDEILGKIGTPFFTTKESGTGLGLSICYAIADKHHAKIAIDSTPHGTTFSVRFALPSAQEAELTKNLHIS